MSGTIETTNNNITTKFMAVNDIIKVLDVYNSTEFTQKTNVVLTSLKEDYDLGTANILSSYFMLSHTLANNDNEIKKTELLKKKDKIFLKYQRFIRKENFISELDRLMRKIKKYVDTTIDDVDTKQSFYKLDKLYHSTTIIKKIKEVVYELCDCTNKMVIEPANSVLVCKHCGNERELLGTVFEDAQFYYQEGQRTKHGTYDPSKHCRFWVERIQARETTEIPTTVIKAISRCIVRDRVRNKNHITCDQIRKYLRETGFTKYNEHVSLLRKMITGITPEQLTDYEMQLVHIYFDKVIRIFDEIKPFDKTNCPYHPYFIYKIIEQIIKQPCHKTRKSKILSCIHLQSRETLIENDRIWEMICERITEFNYTPTDRNAQHVIF